MTGQSSFLLELGFKEAICHNSLLIPVYIFILVRYDFISASFFRYYIRAGFWFLYFCHEHPPTGKRIGLDPLPLLSLQNSHPSSGLNPRSGISLVQKKMP